MAKKLLQHVALADSAGAGRSTAAGSASSPAAAKAYYAMPEIGEDTKTLYNAAQAAEQAVKDSQTKYRESAATLQEKEEALGIWCQMVTAAQDQFYKTGSSYDAARLEKYREQLRSLQQQFFDSQLSFDAAEEDFDAKAGNYKQAVNAYNQYTTRQQALYDDWKSTVRSDTSAVQAELDAVNKQLAQLQGKDTLGKVSHFLGQAAGAAQGNIPTYTPYSSDPQLEELTRRKALLEEELYYSRGFRYDALRENSDFAEKSQYKSTANGKAEKNYLTGGWKNTGYDDINYDYINRVEDAVLKGWSNDNAGNLTWTGYDRSHLQQMSDEEIKMFNYLYASQGSEAAYAYVDYLMTSLTQRQRTEKEAEMAQYAKENPLGASVGSVLLSPLKVMSYAGQIADYAQDGKIDQNAGYNKYSYTNTAIRDAVSKKVEENWGGVGSFAYQTGMSMADFLLNTAITGGNGALSMTVMGSGAAADTTIAAKDRGLNDNQAFALGTVAGLAEAVTERFSLDALLKPGMSKTALGYILKNALTEASEEGASTLINTMADIIISKDKSEWAQSIQAYKKAGKSEGEAFGLALADQARALGLDMLGGFISGGFMATGGAVINHGSAVQIGKVIGAANPDMAQIQDLLLEGLSNDPSTRSNYLAQQYMQKLQRGEKLSNTDLGKLYQANQQVDDRHRGTNAEAAQKMLDEAAQKMAESQAVGNDAVQAEDLQQQAQRLSEVLGREIVLYSEDATENGIRNGYYEDGKIHVNTKSKDPFAQIVSHELTHSVEFADVYDELSQVVLGRIAASGTDLAQLRRQKAALYAANDAVLRDSSEIDKEIVAEYVAKQLLTDEKSIVELTREKPSLGRRILNWLNNLLAKLGNKNAQERAFLSKAKDLYAKALGQSQTSFTEDTKKTEPVAEDTGNQVPTNPELAEMLAWMREQYANGELTEEEFDSMLDSIMEYEERNNAAEPSEVKHSISPQNSISSGTVRKQDVVSDLRAILNRGGGAAELRQYIAKMEQGTQEAYQNTGFAEQEHGEVDQTAAEAEQIVSAARSQGVSVSEYLQQNWERYDVDGQWNEAARKALEMGRGRRQYSVGNTETARQIFPNMSDAERTEVLRGKRIIAPAYNGEADRAISTEKDIESGKTSLAKAALVRIGEVFEVYTDYNIEDVDVRISLSRGNLRESITKNADPIQLAKLLPILKDTVQNAIGIESHANRYFYDNTTESFDNLLGGYIDGEYFVPVRFGLKHIRGGETVLYVVVDQEKIKAEVLKTITQQNVGSTASHSAFAYTVPQVISLVNSKDLLRYLPDDMLTTDQKKLKQEGLAETIKYINDKNDAKYAKFLAIGNMQAVQSMVNAAAKAAGYDIKAYHGTTNRQEKSKWNPNTREWDTEYQRITVFKRQYPEQVGHFFNSDMDNAGGYGYDLYSVFLMLKKPLVIDCKGQNYSNITYDGKTMDTYEWAAYAKKQRYDGVIFENISDGVGYDDLSRLTTDYVVFDSNRIKSSEAVVYDNDGNVIPISQRFDVRKNDIRYSISGNPETEVKDAEQTEIDGTKLRAQMPAKARDYLKGAERKMLNDLAAKLCVPYSAKREYLLPIVEEISSEYLQNGMVSEQAAERLFNKAYEQGMVVDTEYYDRYKDVKDHLRTVAVTLSTADQADIADFGDFRKRARGLLRIVNQGGMPVDSYYRELREMAPELFPDYITHPADQLQKMYKVAGDIRRVEKTLREYYGKEEASFRRWAKNDFNTAVADFASELQTVKRYAEEKTAEKETRVPLTQKEAMDEYAKLKEARRSYEKVAAKNLLTEHDEAIIGDLLAGKRTLESLDAEEDNVKGITAVYEAKRELAQHMQLIAQYKRSLHKQHRDLADKHLETANEWKDKKAGIAYSRETMRRNVQDIVKDSKVAAEVNKTFFEPVAMAEAAATRFKEQYRSKVRELNLSRKVLKGNAVSEAHAVQLLGEAMDNIAMIERARGRMKTRDGKTLTEWQAVITNLWQESPKLDKQKIEGAVEAFRKIYDELFVRMNEVRVANGYEPVNYRKGYFPHFQPGASDGILAHFGKALGISTDVVALPTTINGLTHTFKPGIQWFGNAQERLGFNTAYDAVEGFDKYIEGVASVIHQTENIQRLRALATQIRYRTSDDGLREQVDKIRARDDLTEEQREALVTDLYSKGRFTLSNFVVELDEYTNLLANKKSKLDRTVEAMMGRRIYTFMKWWEGRVGANMIAGNLSSALTNFIPLTQAGAQLDRGALVKGMWETLRAIRQSDLLVERSDFITNRRGSDPLVKTWVQKASGVAGKPMELIDSFVSESIVRAAYHQNVKRGMTEEDAMHYADVFAANVMADRSKGAMPTLFESHNPLFKAFTQFQLEVNNQFSEVFKDLPRGFKEKGLKTLAWVLLKYFLGAWLYNEVFEYLFGRRSALDPLGILNETVGDFTGYELPNLLELLGGAVDGDMPSFETERLGLGEAIGNLGNNLLSELPFSAGLTLIGVETDGGRIPASSAVPDLTALKDALFNTEWSAEKRWKEAADEIAKPLTYIIPPFGGNQLSKAWKGLSAYFAGGSYTVDKDGNDILQYPIFKDGEKDSFLDAIKAGIMGKSSMPEAKKWVDSGFDSFSAKQTTVYQDLLAAGVKDRDAYSLLRELEGAAKTETMSKYQAQRKILDGSAISDEGKAIVFYGLVATESDRELMDKLADLGADSAETGKVAMGLRDTNELKGVEKKQARSDLLIDSGLTDEEKTAVMETILGSELLNENGNPTQYAKLLCAVETGLPVDSYLKLYGVGADMDKYFDFVDAGLDPEDAVEATFAFAELEPEEGKEQVANIQRWEMCVEAFADVRDQLLALRGTMTDPQYEKAEIASNYGVSPRAYVKFLRSMTKYDADGNGKYTQAEVKVAVDAMGGASRQKAVLWQLITGSTSAKNNPYSVEIGQRIIDARNGDEAAKDGLTFSELIMQQILENRK